MATETAAAIASAITTKLLARWSTTDPSFLNNQGTLAAVIGEEVALAVSGYDTDEDTAYAAADAAVLAQMALATTPGGASYVGVYDVALRYAGATVETILAELALRNQVRGVVFANVADLTAFTVAGNDGLTYVVNDRVLLTAQTTAPQCGIYSCGTVGGGTCALTRVGDMPATATNVNGRVIEVSEGTIYAGSSWKSMTTGAKVIATDDPLFYPRTCKGVATLSSGIYALGSTEGLFLFSTTKSIFTLTRNTFNTSTATTGGYAVPVGTRTAGKSGTGAGTITAQVAAGTTNTADVSTIDWLVTNW